jgi:hypothetical protein
MSKKTTSAAAKPTKVKKAKVQVPVAMLEKEVKHNKKFPIEKVSRTKMVQLLNQTKGKFFTSTHIDKDGNPRTMNAVKSNKPASELGYILVYSMRDKGYRNINPQTLTDLSTGKTHYVAKKK